MNNETNHVRCVLVGDGCAGKSCMARTYATKKFHPVNMPTVFDDVAATSAVNGEFIKMNLHLTAGEEDYDRLRPLGYLGAHVFLICFSIASPYSFMNIADKWYPEVRLHCPKVPIILVGCKLDLRDDPTTIVKKESLRMNRDLAPITYKQGLKLMKEIGAVKYLGMFMNQFL